MCGVAPCSVAIVCRSHGHRGHVVTSSSPRRHHMSLPSYFCCRGRWLGRGRPWRGRTATRPSARRVVSEVTGPQKRKLAKKKKDQKKTYEHRVSQLKEHSDTVHAATRGTATWCVQQTGSTATQRVRVHVVGVVVVVVLLECCCRGRGHGRGEVGAARRMMRWHVTGNVERVEVRV
jgi:hypothetical protein